MHNIDNLNEQAGNKRFISILFHSKGMDIVNLPSLLHNKMLFRPSSHI